MVENLSKETRSHLLKLGLYQLIGGGVGVLLILWSVINSDLTNNLLVMLFLVMLVFFAYSILCGVLCLKYNERCLKYSLINQILQLIGVAAFGFAFEYAAGIYLHVGLDLTEGFLIGFGFGISKMIININTEPSLFELHFNIVALLLIIWIEKTTRRLKAEKQYKEVEELVRV
jgi:hypothetical protein